MLRSASEKGIEQRRRLFLILFVVYSLGASHSSVFVRTAMTSLLSCKFLGVKSFRSNQRLGPLYFDSYRYFTFRCSTTLAKASLAILSRLQYIRIRNQAFHSKRQIGKNLWGEMRGTHFFRLAPFSSMLLVKLPKGCSQTDEASQFLRTSIRYADCQNCSGKFPTLHFNVEAFNGVMSSTFKDII